MAGTPLTDAINALTTYSNTVTGASDTTLSEAVATLASGYGGGGSGGIPHFATGNIQAVIFNSAYVETDYYGTLQDMIAIAFKQNTVVNYEHFFGITAGSTRIGLQRLLTNTVNADRFIAGASQTMNGVLTAIYPTVVEADNRSGTAQTVTKPLLIGAGYFNGNMESQKSNMTFYALDILSSSNEYVARYVPWLEGSTPCIKDIVSSSLYYPSAGTFGYIDNNGTIHN